MKERDFFDGVDQLRMPWRDTTVPVPVFYQDVRMLAADFLAPLEKVSAALPSQHLHPWRITPWHSLVEITAIEYRQCDIGPYNEVAIAIPVTLERPLPVFTGPFREMPAAPDAYFLHLPVTTEIACSLGIEMLGLPKFVAD